MFAFLGPHWFRCDKIGHGLLPTLGMLGGESVVREKRTLRSAYALSMSSSALSWVVSLSPRPEALHTEVWVRSLLIRLNICFLKYSLSTEPSETS